VQSLLAIDDAWLAANRHTTAILTQTVGNGAAEQRRSPSSALHHAAAESGNDSDESIASSDDDHLDENDVEEDMSDDDDDDDDMEVEPVKTKTPDAVSWRKLPALVTKHHQRYAPYACVDRAQSPWCWCCSSSTLRKWQEKTGVDAARAGKSDRARQLALLRHNRSRARRLGQTEASVDDECFDDSEFYHQLLKQLIERKGNKVCKARASMQMRAVVDGGVGDDAPMARGATPQANGRQAEEGQRGHEGEQGEEDSVG